MIINVVTPVFNDWESLGHLLDALGNLVQPDPTLRFHIVIVDDGSTDSQPDRFELGSRIDAISTIRLACNLGHQRAIAVGLVYCYEHLGGNATIVMDSDGEDRPEHIPALIAAARESDSEVICATRARRTESLTFRVNYWIYKRIFRTMTGRPIDFGNFCLIPPKVLRSLVHTPQTWSHLAATLTSGQFRNRKVPVDRGTRYAGASKMNFVRLVLHGLGAVAVHTEVFLVRLICGLVALAGGAVVGLLVVLFQKYFTDAAIAGWATAAAGILFIVLLISLLFSVVLIFVVLNARTLKPVLPAQDASAYISAVDRTMR